MFGKSAKTATAAEKSISYIGGEMAVTGDIDTPGALHIDGKVTGDVRCGALTQGAGGAVHGNIKVGEARLAGLIDGAVEAGNLSLEASARVTGDVLYDSLSVATGAEVEGRFRRRRGGEAEGSAAAKTAASAKPARGKGAAAAAAAASAAPAPTPLFGGGEETAEAAE